MYADAASLQAFFQRIYRRKPDGLLPSLRDFVGILHRHLPDQIPAGIYRGAALYRLLVRSRSEEHTSELQSLMRISYAVFCLKKKSRGKVNLLYMRKDKFVSKCTYMHHI